MSRVVVIGGGPAGLAAAIELRRRGAGEVVVIERDGDAGGVPRHCDHPGFGLRDLRWLLGGPSYARRYVGLAERAGVEIRTRTTVTGFEGSKAITTTSPGGLDTIRADAILLATGCRERPRGARLVAGTRPAGVLTTGSLQQLVHLRHEHIGRRAVVVGAEHVSFSAVMTLREAGCETVAMVTEHPAHQTFAALAWIAARGVPILPSTRVVSIQGRERVEGVTLADGRTLACDTVVFTGDWIPDHELARRAGLAIDPGTRGPRVDRIGRTSSPGVFAAGNLVHAAEPADVAALGGRAAAEAITSYLGTERWPDPVPVVCERPIRWTWPNALAADVPAMELLYRVEAPTSGHLVAEQAGRILGRARVRGLVPNRSLRVRASWLRDARAGDGPVRVTLA